MQYQGEVRDTAAYRAGFEDRETGKLSNSQQYSDPLDRSAYLIGYLSDRHRK